MSIFYCEECENKLEIYINGGDDNDYIDFCPVCAGRRLKSEE